jgi:hypothetical protein
VSKSAVRDLVTDVEDAMLEADVNNTILIIHLKDNNVYTVVKSVYPAKEIMGNTTTRAG